MDLKELDAGIDPDIHWYYQTKCSLLHRYFKRKIAEERKITLVDFGAGSGFFAIDLYKNYPDKIDKVYLVDIGYSEQELEESKGTSIEKVHQMPEGLSNVLILFMDVLEHIEDDYAILKTIKQKCGKNVHYFITVPAFQALWSSHDVYLEHYRRYTLKSLRKLLKGSELTIDRMYYSYFLLFPVAFLVRKLRKNNRAERSDMQALPALFNNILKYYHKLELHLGRLNRLFGLTCVAEGKLS